MAPATATTGPAGERLAALVLERHGCGIVERNSLVGVDEIDLVVRHGGRIVAVEVKTATNGDDPLEAVDEGKFDRLERAVMGHRLPISRIDLVGIEVTRGFAVVRWLQGVR